MTSTGMAAAKSEIRSTFCPFRSFAFIWSSSFSIRQISPGSISLMALGTNAPRMSLRTRVCSGGSLKTRLVV